MIRHHDTIQHNKNVIYVKCLLKLIGVLKKWERREGWEGREEGKRERREGIEGRGERGGTKIIT